MTKKWISKKFKILSLEFQIWQVAFLFFLLFAILFKLWLVSGQPLFAINAPFDDGLFVNLSYNIRHGFWLGTFDKLTLSKGPFYPFYLAINSATHIPLLLSQHLFYILSVLVFIICVYPFLKVFKKPKIVAITILLLSFFLFFNPITSDLQGTRVIRDGIYPALTLLTISFFICLASFRERSLKLYILISIAAGLSLSAFWLTREEGVWLIPFTVGLTIFLLVLEFLKKRSRLEFSKSVGVLVLPFFILYISLNLVSFINFRLYGIYNVVEFRTPQFLSAYSSLTRVKSDKWLPVIPVSTYSRQLVYKVSPTSSELKRFLEGDTGKGWEKVSETMYPQYKGEIAGGWFLWAFRDAVAEAGYYKSGKDAMNFYSEMSKEINSACENKKLDCVKSTNSMTPPLNQYYVQPFISTFFTSSSFLVNFKDYNPTPSNIPVDPSTIKLFTNITHEEITNSYGHRKVEILEIIGKFYQTIFPILTIISIGLFFLILIVNRPLKDLLFVITGLIGLTVLVRIGLLSLISVTSFNSISTGYLSSAYPLLIIFDFLCLFLFSKYFFKFKRFSFLK